MYRGATETRLGQAAAAGGGLGNGPNATLPENKHMPNRHHFGWPDQLLSP